jgi:membrane-associated protease RseP (regulator of RpoE activity)
MGLIGIGIGAVFIGLAVFAGRWLASRAFGIRDLRRATNSEEERGRPSLAFARAAAAIACVYLACVLLFVPGLASGRPVVDEQSMRVTVTANGPASRAGIGNGDRIVSVNGEAPRDWDHLKKMVGAHPDEVITVDVERAGERKAFSVRTEGPKMMVAPFVEHRTPSFGEALGEAFVEPIKVARMFVRGLARTIGGAEKPELSGPVGVSREMTSAAESGTGTFLRLIAAMAAYEAIFVDLALLAVALVMSILPRRNSVLPTSGNPS